MKILITAGNTQSPIDKVRCITNIFSGRTGARIAGVAAKLGHRVTFVTSHPEALTDVLNNDFSHEPPGLSRGSVSSQTTSGINPEARSKNIEVRTYRTFEELEAEMAQLIVKGSYDAIIHAAAVNDYHVIGTYVRKDDEMIDVSAGKVKSHHPELWLKLKPAAKLVDKIRSEWGFQGTLVKFKLEVDVTDEQLLKVAEASRVQSSADIMVANTLEGMHEWAYLGTGPDQYRRIDRANLAETIIEMIAKEI